MFMFPKTELGMKAGIIAVPLVCIFVWLFNSYKIGRLGGKKPVFPDNSPQRTGKGVVAVLLFIIAITFVLGKLLS